VAEIKKSRHAPIANRATMIDAEGLSPPSSVRSCHLGTLLALMRLSTVSVVLLLLLLLLLSPDEEDEDEDDDEPLPLPEPPLLLLLLPPPDEELLPLPDFLPGPLARRWFCSSGIVWTWSFGIYSSSFAPFGLRTVL